MTLILYFHLLLAFFFFLMIRRPPRSTLFPTRRSSDLDQRFPDIVDQLSPWGLHERAQQLPHHALRSRRSEEHTSELQSRFDLVCRLLLEKKKEIDETVTLIPCSQKKRAAYLPPPFCSQ